MGIKLLTMEQNNTITVTNCENCPMYDVVEHGELCRLVPDSDNLFATCPLKTNSLTIQLKQDAPQT